MAKVRQSNLDESIVTGLTDLGANVASGDYTLIYDASTGTLKKISQVNLLNVPLISSVSPTNVNTGDGTGNATFTITGTGFSGASAKLLTAAGAEVNFDTVTVDNSTQITGVIAVSSLSNDNEPYDVKVISATGLSSTLADQININAQPVFQTASGSVGSFQEQTTISTINIVAADPESTGNVTFEIISGSLPAGLSATTVNEDGVSKYRITGTLTTDISSNTTSNFTLRASDANSNTSTRAFSITETPYNVQSFTSSGTFSVPSGVTSVDVLVVAGGGGASVGGGGAGGLIYMPGYPVTPGGTVSVTVGCGGAHSTVTDNSPSAAHGIIGQDSGFGTLTAKGGGGGGHHISSPGQTGGSGGGAGRDGGGAPGGPATQPTQPGNSGTYGFGTPGGAGPGPSGSGAGGGGGAGAGGGPGGNDQSPTSGLYGYGGAGKAYTIADGATPVYYAGGGGGYGELGPATSRLGGCGGGGDGVGPSPRAGEANKGGGGGGQPVGGTAQGQGGKGIVIVKY